MISNRIKELLDKKDIAASTFADMVGTSRSSISHILSGRNKPSLDLVKSIVEKFPEVTYEYLIHGTTLSKLEEKEASRRSHSDGEKQAHSTRKTKTLVTGAGVDTRMNEDKTAPVKMIGDATAAKKTNKIAKGIIVLYEDGTFEKFIP